MKQRNFINDWFQPWKLVTLALGIGVLILGAKYYQFPDWDIPVSFIMAICTYCSAPWVIDTLVKFNWRKFWLAAIWVELSVDFGYHLYWTFHALAMIDNHHLAALDMREVNFPASLVLYFAFGLIVYPHGSFKELLKQLSYALRNPCKPL